MGDKTRIVVVGGGPGGYVGGIRAAQLGADVTVVERGLLGGTCLNRGCIPTKVLLAGTEALAKARSGAEFGFRVNGEIVPDFERMMERKEEVVTRLREGIHLLFKKAGVQFVQGRGRIVAPGKVEVETALGLVVLECDFVIIATGSEPAHLPLFDFSQPCVLTSTSALDLEEIPESLLVVGAGPIGCEFACIFAELGTAVTLVEVKPQVLPQEDRRLAKQFEGTLRKRGIQLRLDMRVERVLDYRLDGLSVALSNGERVDAARILVSVGRRPNSENLGLRAVGIATDAKGFIVVDEHLRTSAPGFYAAGDVNGGLLLAHVASHEAVVAVENCMGIDRTRDLELVPSATYTRPEVASVGLSEQQARDGGFRPVTGTYRFATLGRALVLGEPLGFVQIVADRDTDRVLGASMMGPHATDLIHEVSAAMRGGLTASRLGDLIHAHPTFAEAVMEAALDVHGDSVHVAS